MAKSRSAKPKTKSGAKARGKTKAKTKRVSEKKSWSSTAAVRIDKLVNAQKSSITHVSEFAQSVADLAVRGNFSPRAWVTQYAALLHGLSDDMATAVKSFLDD